MPPRSGIHESLREGLPACCLVGILGIIPAHLERSQWFSPTTNLYVWTLIWMVTFLASWRFLVKQGPLMVLANGCIRNLLMLRDLYGLLGIERCGRIVGVADLILAGIVSALACGGSYYFATRYCYAAASVAEKEGRVGDVEKDLDSSSLSEP